MLPKPACACGAVLEWRVMIGIGADGTPRSILRCRRCDLLSPHPLPSAEELRAQYNGYGTYAMRAQLSDDVALKRSQAQDVAAKLKKRLGKSIQGLKLVEVGCAAGALLVGLADAGFDVRGVEVDQVNGQVALQRMGTGKVHIGSLETAAFADESFDVVFSDQVIEHVADTRPFVNECFRILKPGGLMWVGTPNFGGLSARLLKHRWKECVPTEHIRMFTPESMRYYLMGGGFSRVEVWTHGLSLVRRVGHAESEYRQNLLPLRREGLARRTLSKLASLASMGDGLSAFALRS